MMLPFEYSLNRESESKWIVSFDTGGHFVVNRNTVQLLEILKSASSIEAAFNSYQNRDDLQACTFEQFQTLSDSVLNRLKLAANKEYIAPSPYIHLRFTLIPKPWVSFLAAPLKGLFWPPLFILTFIALLCSDLLLLAQASWPVSVSWSYQGALTLAGIVILSTLIHEFGHIACCRYYGAKHGEIGMGVYFIFPVAYSDVTGIWALPKGQRIAVNLAGVYVELLFVALLLFLSRAQPILLYACAIIMLRMLYTMLPFFRSDGYWVLADLLNEQSLLKHANQAVQRQIRAFIARLTGNKRGEKSQKFTAKECALLSYGVFNLIYFPLFIFILAARYTEELLNFPWTAVDLLTGQISILEQSKGFAAALILYLLLSVKLYQRMKARWQIKGK